MQHSSAQRKQRGRTIAFLALPLIVVAASSGRIPEASEDESEPHVSVVRAEDIPDHVQIIGSLGRPLGEMLVITGHWWEPGRKRPVKDMQLRFQVTDVNGQQLEKPVLFRRELVEFVDVGSDKSIPKPEHGAVWELRGVQTGGFRDLPGHAWKAALELEGLDALPFGTDHDYGFQFVTDFHYVSCKVLDTAEQQGNR